jgi:hypothetical protein
MSSEPQLALKRRLKDLQFGFVSADHEASYDPDLLLRGFVDPFHLVDEAKNGRSVIGLRPDLQRTDWRDGNGDGLWLIGVYKQKQWRRRRPPYSGAVSNKHQSFDGLGLA